MKALIFKSIALIAILAFAFVLVSQHDAYAQGWDCQNAKDLCDLGMIIAVFVCVTESPEMCNLANLIAGAVCDWAKYICDGNG